MKSAREIALGLAQDLCISDDYIVNMIAETIEQDRSIRTLIIVSEEELSRIAYEEWMGSDFKRGFRKAQKLNAIAALDRIWPSGDELTTTFKPAFERWSWSYALDCIKAEVLKKLEIK